MQNDPRIYGPQQSLLLAAGTVAGVALLMGILTQLPLTQAAVATSIGLASLIVACASLSEPILVNGGGCHCRHNRRTWRHHG